LYPIFGLSLTFNTFLTNEYVGSYWNQVNADFVQDIATNLLTVFKRIIKRNTWLTEETKLYALKKLDHLELIIAKPKKLREDPLLEYEEKDAWYNMSLIGKWRKDKYIKLQGKEIVDVPLIDWKNFKLVGTQAYVVNAYYEMNKNKIFVPLAIMQHPCINLDERGLEYNIARIGYTLGNEMSHALDNTGSKYDYKGNLYNWWKPSDQKKYNEIVKNIIKQYETFASYDGIKFNAELTVGEDMADISGMAICQEYLLDYFDVNDIEMSIRELELKVFYVHYASHQRQHIYKRALKAQLNTNPHPLDKYRTNCVLARLEIFKVIYEIKKGDKMWWHTNDVNSTIWN
jgi:predicted metalloendopeptidase